MRPSLFRSVRPELERRAGEGGWRARFARFIMACATCAVAVPAGDLAARQSSGGGGLTPATECCLVLLIPVGAQSVALGRATTSATTPDAVFGNPAGVAGLEGSHFVVHHSSMITQASAFSLLFTPSGVGTVGLSYELVDEEEIEQTDEQGRTIGAVTLRHHVLVGTFGTTLASWLSAGINYKFYQMRIGCRGTCEDLQIAATTHAVDVGIRIHPERIPGLRLGATASNMGFPLQVINAKQADPLPVRLRLGMAYEVLRHLQPVEDIELWWAVEVIENWNDRGAPTASVGVELAARDAVFLRAGYVPGEGLGTGAAIGIGVHYDRITVSVSRSFASSLLETAEDPVQFSLGLRF